MNRDNQSSRGIPLELAQRLVAAVRSEQVANEIVDEHVAQFLGINRTDGRCLDIVERHGRVTAGALAVEASLTTGAVTAVVDRLELAGYLQRVRDTADRRKVYIELTPLMVAITKRLFYNLEELFQGIMSRLTPRDVQAITEFLRAGIFIHGHRARLLKEHLPANLATPEQRLDAAAAYDKAIRKAAPSIAAQVRAGDIGD